jgi:hypothetical protein
MSALCCFQCVVRQGSHMSTVWTSHVFILVFPLMFVAQVTGKYGSIICPLLELFEGTEILTEQNYPYLQPHIKFQRKLLR